MKDNYSHIAILLDRSGSMAKLSTETIAGLNSFIADQKKEDGEATFSLATFASDYTLIYDFLPLKTVQPLLPEAYRTAGFTSLLYSMGKLITDTGVRLASIPEENRPSRVIVVVLTDGEENNSHKISNHEYTRAKVFEMIKHQQDKYQWTVVFLGCSQEQIGEAQSIGVFAANTLQYTHTAAGIGSAYATMNTSMRRARSGMTTNANFFDGKDVIIPDPSIKVDGSKVS
jgi:uncharacterized protein YegL